MFNSNTGNDVVQLDSSTNHSKPMESSKEIVQDAYIPEIIAMAMGLRPEVIVSNVHPLREQVNLRCFICNR